ncbi:MAG: metallophosphoesterase family protein [Planctomycetes bacterium]|nr:metallophosphoesterase family protein [Planctomycetota bacterium]
MKLAVISDLHSNRAALEAVFAHVRGLSIERIVCLGDVVGYGPDPEYCVDLVRGHAEWCLLGNHDEALFGGAEDFNPHARAAIEFTRERMLPRWYSSGERKARWEWLKSLEKQRGEGRFLFVHGSPRDPVREYVLSTDGFLNPEKMRDIFAHFAGHEVTFAGHTHQPGVHDEELRFHGLDPREASTTMALPAGRRFFVNVGSVGQPRDGDNRACYAVVEQESVTWHRVAYDYRATMERIRDTRVLPEVLARRLEIGK